MRSIRKPLTPDGRFTDKKLFGQPGDVDMAHIMMGEPYFATDELKSRVDAFSPDIQEADPKPSDVRDQNQEAGA